MRVGTAVLLGVLAVGMQIAAAAPLVRDPCLFSPKELAPFLGYEPAAGAVTESKTGRARTCTYARPDRGLAFSVWIEIGDRGNFARERSLAEKLAQPHEFRDLDGIGDAAFVAQGGTVHILSGDRIVWLQHLRNVTTRKITDDDIRALAQLAAKRLSATP
jgi:hypothetical protein